MDFFRIANCLFSDLGIQKNKLFISLFISYFIDFIFMHVLLFKHLFYNWAFVLTVFSFDPHRYLTAKSRLR